MAVASKSAVPVRKRRAPSRARTVAASHLAVKPLAATKFNHSSTSSQVPILPSSQSAPFWLQQLCRLQRQSTVLTFLLVTATLGLYGWTVYCQQLWSQSYHKLVILQRDERQLTTTSEVLKNQMALQAEQPNTGLVPSSPTQAIFLQPAPQLPAPIARAGILGNKVADQTPMGY